jgi:choline monooxygenase
MSTSFHVDPDIRKAETLPASFYRDKTVFELLKNRVFYRTWQWVGDETLVPKPLSVHPFVLLEGFLTEPVLLTRDAGDKVHCFSNVCTHRGNLLVREAGSLKKIVCGYHGRRFSLEGAFEHMPEFKEAEGFPRPCDDLNEFPLRTWGPFLFAGLHPAFDFQQVIDTMQERVGFLPLEQFKLDASRSKDYEIHAHWALYCDNYLEGFHIPFVHEDLNTALDYGSYDTELYDYHNLQIGYADQTEDVFDFPTTHPDYGKKIAAYYYWVFPNMMFNFYPWGLSVNIVKPLAIDKTRVSFFSYVYDASKLDTGAGALLDKVELEDEAVVEGVQKGVNSLFYKAGRFSPTREKGVYHFHRLLAEFLEG